MSSVSLSSANASFGPTAPNLPQVGRAVVLSHDDRNGVIVMAVAGVISCTLVSALLLFILYSALSPWLARGSAPHSPFLGKQIAVFVICLLVSDFIQSIAGVTQMKWAIENRIYDGSACTIQAVTLVIGDLASTLWSCVIAAHTFCGIALRKQWPTRVVCATVGLGWTFVLVLVVAGPTAVASPDRGPFFGIAGTWCFISSAYEIPRLGIHYVPIFVGSIMIIVLYSLVFLIVRGSIGITRKHVKHASTGWDSAFSRERAMIARRMLWYPVAYLTCAMPISIVRLIGLGSTSVPESLWVIGMFLLFLIGTVDSIIYATTRTLIKSSRRIDNSRGSQLRDRPTTRSVVSTTPQISLVLDRVDGYKRMEYRPDSITPQVQRDFEGLRDHKNGAEELLGHESAANGIHVTLETIQHVI